MGVDLVIRSGSGNRGGLEHFLPVTFGVNAGRISIEDLACAGTSNTAKVFGLYPRKGALVPGADGGMATTTIVRGRVMMEGGATVDKPGWGRYVPRGPAAQGGAR